MNIISVNKQLEDIFYNQLQGIGGRAKLLLHIRNNPELSHISQKQVHNFFSQQAVSQLARRPVKPKRNSFNTINAKAPLERLQVDLMIYTRWPSRSHAQYILNVIDVYSRYVWNRVLTNRKLPTLVDAMKNILQEIEDTVDNFHPNQDQDNLDPPMFLSSDNEFNKKSFIDLCNQHGIFNYFSEVNQPHKNALVERFNGTLSHLLQQYRVTHTTVDWKDAVPVVTKLYNESLVHASTRQTPYNVLHMIKVSRQVIRRHKTDFKVGDRVRIKVRYVQGNLREKGDALQFSKKVHVIQSISVNGQVVTIEGIHNRTFKPYELEIAAEKHSPDVASNIERQQRSQLDRLLAIEQYTKQERKKFKKTAAEPRERHERAERAKEINYDEEASSTYGWRHLSDLTDRSVVNRIKKPRKRYVTIKPQAHKIGDKLYITHRSLLKPYANTAATNSNN